MRPYFTLASLERVKFTVTLLWYSSHLMIISVCVFAVLMLNSWRRLSSRWPRLWVCVLYNLLPFHYSRLYKRRMLISNPLSCEIKVCNFRLCAHEATWFKWLPIPSPLCFYDVLYVIYCSSRFLIILLIWLSSSIMNTLKMGAIVSCVWSSVCVPYSSEQPQVRELRGVGESFSQQNQRTEDFHRMPRVSEIRLQ